MKVITLGQEEADVFFIASFDRTGLEIDRETFMLVDGPDRFTTLPINLEIRCSDDFSRIISMSGFKNEDLPIDVFDHFWQRIRNKMRELASRTDVLGV